MPSIEGWIYGGIAHLELSGAPPLTWTLSRDYVTSDGCFADTQTTEQAGTTHIEIDAHPKTVGLTVQKLTLRWRLPFRVGAGATAERGIMLSPGSDPLILWSERELEATTQLRIEAPDTLILERDFGARQLLHTLPVVRLHAGPASACPDFIPSQERLGSASALLIPTAWLEDDQRDLQDLLTAPAWESLGIAALVLDARLSMNAALAEAQVRQRWQAFAKTCSAAGLQAGVTSVPTSWSARGYAAPDSQSAAVPIARPAWVSAAHTVWSPALSERGHEVDFEQQAARDALIQWLLWLVDLGFGRVDMLELGNATTQRDEPRQHSRSLAQLLELLRQDNHGLSLYADASVSAEQAVGCFVGQSSLRPLPQWKAPSWPSRRPKPAAPPSTHPYALGIVDPLESVLTHLGAGRHAHSSSGYGARFVALANPPSRPLPPKPSYRDRFPALPRWLGGQTTSTVEPDVIPSWPPKSFWQALQIALRQRSSR